MVESYSAGFLPHFVFAILIMATFPKRSLQLGDGPGDIGYHPHYHIYKVLIFIPYPRKYSIHGIDVSYYQGRIDWRLW